MRVGSWVEAITAAGMEIVGVPMQEEEGLVELMIAGYGLAHHSHALAQTVREICIARHVPSGEDWFFFTGVEIGRDWELELRRRWETTIDAIWVDRTRAPEFQARFQCVLGTCHQLCMSSESYTHFVIGEGPYAGQVWDVSSDELVGTADEFFYDRVRSYSSK